MDILQMANKMTENNKPEISKEVAKEVMQSSVRTTAADLLTDLAKLHGFNEDSQTCEFKGSIDNQAVVKRALVEKYGDGVASEYIPTVNVKPKTKWLQEGYSIKEGEKPLCFIHTWRDHVLWTVPMWHENQMEINI